MCPSFCCTPWRDDRDIEEKKKREKHINLDFPCFPTFILILLFSYRFSVMLVSALCISRQHCISTGEDTENHRGEGAVEPLGRWHAPLLQYYGNSPLRQIIFELQFGLTRIGGRNHYGIYLLFVSSFDSWLFIYLIFFSCICCIPFIYCK